MHPLAEIQSRARLIGGAGWLVIVSCLGACGGKSAATAESAQTELKGKSSATGKALDPIVMEASSPTAADGSYYSKVVVYDKVEGDEEGASPEYTTEYWVDGESAYAVCEGGFIASRDEKGRAWGIENEQRCKVRE